MNDDVHPQASQPDFLTIDEVAVLLRCSVKRIRRRVTDGDIPAFRLADRGPWLFCRDDVLRQLTPVPVAAIRSNGSGTCSPSASVDWVAGLTGATTPKAHQHGA